MSEDMQKSSEFLCKNCSHPVTSHQPDCLFSPHNRDGNPCGCSEPEYYNTIVSDKYMGWTEIHCNSCGTLLAYLNSTVENIYDYTTLCANCIAKAGHPD